MAGKSRGPLVVALIVAFFAGTYATKRHFVKKQKLSARPFEAAVLILDGAKNKEWCDEQQAAHRLFVAKVIDRFRGNIDELWQRRKAEDFAKEKLVALGPILLRPAPERIGTADFDRTVWNWVETYAKLQQTQSRGEEKLWFDVDTAAQYLLRKDTERIVRGVRFPAPSLAEHMFRPNTAVRRAGGREFRVELDPGDFAGHKKELARLVEGAWRGPKYRVRIDWVPGKAGAYRVVARKESGRSFTNHTDKTLVLANFSNVSTVAHEVGHVLGFDDHYYDVWHEKYCYYTQEYRKSDLMSDSAAGGVAARHWELLDQAYPWQKPARGDAFAYTYGSVK